jgi:hypothetical protein
MTKIMVPQQGGLKPQIPNSGIAHDTWQFPPPFNLENLSLFQHYLLPPIFILVFQVSIFWAVSPSTVNAVPLYSSYPPFDTVVVLMTTMIMTTVKITNTRCAGCYDSKEINVYFIRKIHTTSHREKWKIIDNARARPGYHMQYKFCG